MNIALRHFFAWCTVINYAILIVWFVAMLIGRDWIARLHAKLLGVSEDRVKTIHFYGIAFYKIGILLFNLVPYLALRIMG